jgi:hypothetical protein
VKGTRTANDVGSCMEANPDDWWTLDTHSVGTPDVQIFSSDTMKTGSGVYWMFYTGPKPLRYTAFLSVDACTSASLTCPSCSAITSFGYHGDRL